MNKSLRIVVADDEVDMRDWLTRMLPRLGHEVVGVAADGQQLVDRCLEARPDLAITDIRMPLLDGIQAAQRIYDDRPLPVILVSAFHDPELIARAEADHVLAYLVKPIEQKDLAPAIAIAMRRFEQFETLRREAADLRQALEDRKTIERAKGIVMRRAALDEADAFRRLQDLASRQNRKLVEIARQLLLAEEAFAPSPGGGDGAS